MRQMYDLDNVILSKILDNSLKIDIEKGMIFGVRCDVSGNRLPVGRIDKRSGHILFSLVHNNMSRSYYVCRAVYLSVYGKIPDGYIITHINNDIKNNCINNLHLSIPVENSAANNNCGRGRWTVEEESFLIENYGNLSYNELTTSAGNLPIFSGVTGTGLPLSSIISQFFKQHLKIDILSNYKFKK